ncbi:MAG: hypothetical protein IT462_10815 [Planctomycetes bacterium]|nr:hypothetical protein [Planctomycetota bacterium]
MPKLIAIVPCETFFALERPQRMLGPGFEFGDEFGLPEEIDIYLAVSGLGQGDPIVVELVGSDGAVLAASSTAAFEVPDYNVPGDVAVTLSLLSVHVFGRYTLMVRSGDWRLGETDVQFCQVPS